MKHLITMIFDNKLEGKVLAIGRIFCVILIIIFLISGDNTSFGQIINVPGDYPTIQQGIDAATDGDTVLVQPGTYYENLDMGYKTLVLLSSNQDETIIDGNQTGMGLIIRTSGSVIDGFTITNTSAPQYNIRWVSSYGYHTSGTGIFAGTQSLKPTIRNCILHNNEIAVYGNADLINCIIFDNNQGFTGYWTHPIMKKCQFYNNNTGVYISNAANSKFINCEFIQNDLAINMRSDLNAWGFNVDIYHCNFKHNENLFNTIEGNTTNIVNTIIFNNVNPVLEFNQGHDTVNINNCIIENGVNAIGTTSLSNVYYDQSTNLSVNPQFENETDSIGFVLSDNSEAIGSGILIAEITEDLFGNQRPYPVGSNPDIGAHENELGNSTIICDSAIVAHYPFNGNANDESGYGNHGTVNGASLVEDRFGNPQSAYQFDGSDDYISFENPTLTGQEQITYIFWAKSDYVGVQDIMGQSCGSDCGTDVRIQFSASQLHQTGLSFKNPIHIATASSVLVQDDQWHQYALVMGEGGNFSYSNFKFYIDGAYAPVTQGHNWGGWTYSLPNDNFSIGKGVPCCGGYFFGVLDDITIHNNALNASEIDSIYLVELTANSIGQPSIAAATNISDSSFTTNWNIPANGSAPFGYKLDVATDLQFNAILPAYNDLDVGNVLSYNVTDLLPATEYFYRVRSYGDFGTSINSGTMNVVTTQTINEHLFINYQAVLRNQEGIILADTSVNIHFSLQNLELPGTDEYSETHSLISNQFGLLNCKIGNGTATTGNFEDLNWSDKTYQISIALIDDTGSLISLGSEEMSYTPYSMHSLTTADTTFNTLTITSGNLHFSQPSTGMILKSPDGNCWKVTVDNTGNLTSVQVECEE